MEASHGCWGGGKEQDRGKGSYRGRTAKGLRGMMQLLARTVLKFIFLLADSVPDGMSETKKFFTGRPQPPLWLSQSPYRRDRDLSANLGGADLFKLKPKILALRSPKPRQNTIGHHVSKAKDLSH
uniref:Uncharacterized protein n=1 Tax=Oryza brachyantha TaxID=4533 RepID=J3MW10_ORYBR